jgi:hypothetical protein
MSKLDFVFDEDVPRPVPDGLLRLKDDRERIDLVLLGCAEGYPIGLTDDELLVLVERRQRALVARERCLIPGTHTWGLFLLRPGFPALTYVKDLLMIWRYSESHHWRDRVTYLPF